MAKYIVMKIFLMINNEIVHREKWPKVIISPDLGHVCSLFYLHCSFETITELVECSETLFNPEKIIFLM